MIGTKLAHYEITAHLGSGGMGDVYQATDTKLERSVAIKFLPEAFSHDTERVAGFQREARVLASLNHPNIAAIHGVEKIDTRHFLVMELVPGETLADRIKRGAIPIEEALPIAKQIAEALEEAHEKGIIHRDLKPANTKVTPDGKVKVLDFGLAKAYEREQANVVTSNSPTVVSMAATNAGVILGTAAYMSPEQAKGRQLDRRTGIFSFGCVFYEMLTGQPAFVGEDTTEILSKILQRDPDLTVLPANVPPRIRELLGRCFQKDPRVRLRDIGDAQWELARVERNESDPNQPGNTLSRMRLWKVALPVLVVVGGLGWLRVAPTTNVTPNLALTVIPAAGSILRSPVGFYPPEISPDGSLLTYLASDGWNVRRLDSSQPLPLRGIQGSLLYDQFWSADSKSVVMAADNTLIKIRIPDGAPETIATLPGFVRGGTSSDKGTILIVAYAPGSGPQLYALQSDSGEFKRVDATAVGSGQYFWPEFLPGSEDFLFLSIPEKESADAEGEVWLASLRDGKVTNPSLLRRNATAARYTAAGGGRILFVRNDDLYFQKLNLSTRRLDGDPQLIEKGVASIPGGSMHRAEFSVSRSGTVALRPGEAALAQVTIFDRKGNELGKTGPPGPIGWMSVSPDEKRILVNTGGDTWLLDAGQPGHLSLHDGNWRWMLWSPEGARLIGLNGLVRIGERSLSDSGEIREVGDVPGILQDISPDGKEALFMGLNGGIQSQRLEGTPEERKPRTLVQRNEQVSPPRFSPDGHWIVYSILRQGIFVQPFSGPGLRKQISNSGDSATAQAVWRNDGREILYVDAGSVWSVAVQAVGDGLHFAMPQKAVFRPSHVSQRERWVPAIIDVV